MQPDHLSFGVIGGGFSGSLLAVHLLRRLPLGCRVHLIEQRQGFGRGLAYSTGNPSHLLNVRASRMSAFDDDPDHFLRWLAAQPGAHGEFVPRGLYGGYIQSLLAEQLWAEGRNHGLYLNPDEAEALSLEADGATIHMASGRPLHVDVAILAVGHFPPEPPRGAEGLGGSRRYHCDPWDHKTLAAIPQKAPVLVIGTGLTMVDLVLSLLDSGHQGPVTALSRHGLLPHRHAATVPPVPWPEPQRPLALSQMLRQTRLAVEACGDWHAVIDGMRPHLQAWWQALPLRDQKRFLRHLRPWWDIHRHRLAPAVAERLEAALAQGRLTVLAAHVAGVSPHPDGVEIAYRPRGSGDLRRLGVGHVINCSGPTSDYGRVSQPLLRQLFDQTMIRPDPMRLGLDVDDQLRLIDGAGLAHRRLYAVGPLTRGRFWEVTAVPEIRRQAQWLAEHLASQFNGQVASYTGGPSI
jgi:uncharacterized NAD(P)/FAD-binding protein YdhS